MVAVYYYVLRCLLCLLAIDWLVYWCACLLFFFVGVFIVLGYSVWLCSVYAGFGGCFYVGRDFVCVWTFVSLLVSRIVREL